jgi:hypothetical protein
MMNMLQGPRQNENVTKITGTTATIRKPEKASKEVVGQECEPSSTPPTNNSKHKTM